MDGSWRRRQFLAVTAANTVGLSGCEQPFRADRDGPPGTGGTGELPDAVGLETVASGVSAPTDVAFAPGPDRRYIVDQSGRILVHESELRPDPLLDLSGSITAGGEKGLLGLALHPEFARNRRLFVRYSAPPRDGTPTDFSHTFVLAEFETADGGRRVIPGSERTLLEIPEPQPNHNAGDIRFGPDGFLYVAVGDGGAGGDQGRGHVADWYDAIDGGNGQDVTENLLGSILRIDVNENADGNGYAIPGDNPLVGRPGLDEHFAWGFRNPWRMAFDQGDLIVGDVGQSRFEEVTVVEKGTNHGWNVKEGAHCYRQNTCPDAAPAAVRGGESLVDPVIEYPHQGAAVSGISVIGGHVYRGSARPDLEGTYVFGDLRANGQLFTASMVDGGSWPTRVTRITGSDAEKLDRIRSFGRDPNGEMYVLGTGRGGGGLHRIVPAG